MNYISAEKQMQMLEENRLNELIDYAKEHNLSRSVVQKLLDKFRQQQANQVKLSIH